MQKRNSATTITSYPPPRVSQNARGQVPIKVLIPTGTTSSPDQKVTNNGVKSKATHVPISMFFQPKDSKSSNTSAEVGNKTEAGSSGSVFVPKPTLCNNAQFSNSSPQAVSVPMNVSLNS